jgi:hypothetical protein
MIACISWTKLDKNIDDFKGRHLCELRICEEVARASVGINSTISPNTFEHSDVVTSEYSLNSRGLKLDWREGVGTSD